MNNYSLNVDDASIKLRSDWLKIGSHSFRTMDNSMLGFRCTFFFCENANMDALRTKHYACAPRLCNYILASGVLVEVVIAINHNCYHGDSNQRLKYHIFSSNQVLPCSNTGESLLEDC